jgi:hypothetical protein
MSRFVDTHEDVGVKSGDCRTDGFGVQDDGHDRNFNEDSTTTTWDRKQGWLVNGQLY